MVRFVILEDNASERTRLENYLHLFEQEHGIEPFYIRSYERAIPLVEEYRCDADVLLLDIQVSDMLGMEAARRIRQVDTDVIIIFVTNLVQYAIEGYSVQAIDYILKPVAYQAFSAKLERVLRVLSHREDAPSLVLRTRGGQMRLSPSRLVYIEVLNHDLHFHTADGTVHNQWGSLSKIEQQLDGRYFVRCHSSYLVNLKYVQGVQGDRVLVEGEEIPLSKTKRKEFLRALAQYRGGSR